MKRVNMNKMIKLLTLCMLLAIAFMSSGCLQKVPAGHVGVKVYLLGGEKGVNSEELGVGRYWIGWNEDLFLFPTFSQNYVWTKDSHEGSKNDEAISFQTVEGMSVSGDVGITYAVKPKKVGAVFQKYRKQLDEITGIYLRNMVRDAFVKVASTIPVEEVYGAGKAKLLEEVEARVREQTKEFFDIERIYLVGDLRLPDAVITALNEKIQATQDAQKAENQIRQAKAEAQKKIAAADGQAQSLLTVATAQAKANKIIADSLTPVLVQYEALQKWDGVLPRTMLPNGAVPFVGVTDTQEPPVAK